MTSPLASSVELAAARTASRVVVDDVSAYETTEALVPGPSAPECWLDDDTAVLQCRKVLDITHDVKSFHFATTDGSVFAFEPGQFITLDLVIDGRPIQRCYTVSSPPTRPHLISITVKRVAGGPVSNWLHDNVVAGTTLQVKAPLGGFTLRAPTAPKYLFLSGGSGITPVMSMTRTLFDLGSDADIVFVHSARTPADIIFRHELEAQARVMPNLRVMHLCEDDHPNERWMGLKGRVSTGILRTLVPDLQERMVFCCGPAPYMAAVRHCLGELGYDMHLYREESFNFDLLTATEASTTEPAEARSTETQFTVEFARSGVTVQCGPDQTLLDAAFEAGLRWPSSCTQGMCGTCKTVKLDGEVEMHHNGGIRPREIAQNKILLCCSTPLGDVRIDG